MKKEFKKTIGIDARMFSDQFTGIGRYTYEIANRFFKKYKDIHWIIFMNDPQYGDYNFPSNVTKVLVNASHYSFSEQARFLKILNEANCDLVHFTHFNVPILYNKPFIVTIHDTTISFFPGKKMKRWWHKFAYNMVIKHAVFGSKKIITVSENTKHDVMNMFQVLPLKIEAIHNGLGSEFKTVPQKKQKEVLDTYGISENFLLYTGVWREHKNLVRLLKTFAHLRKKNEKENLQLVITGKEDPHYPEIKATIKKLHLEKSVHLIGLVPKEDLISLYNAAILYIFPSLYEGFGFPPLEAMKTKTPVVASHVASIPEVCGDGVAYFDPYDIDDMVHVIHKTYHDKELQKKLIKEGEKQVLKYSWTDCANKTFQVYESILNN